MKKEFTALFTILVILSTPTAVLAAKSGVSSASPGSAGNGSQAQTQSQQQVRVSPAAVGNQVRNTNQIQVQNQGEDSQVRTSNQEQEEMGTGSADSKKLSPRSETAREHMSAVAVKVEELLETRSAKGGIGQQISEFAQGQRQSQEEIEETLEVVETRSGFAKILLGPNYKALNKIEKEVEQNQVRIEALKQLENQVVNQGDKTKLQETVEALVQQNTALQELVNAESRVRSAFGWLVRLFNR
ncbi:MAG: hypothetical protein ACOX50_04680 [Patescibacteria group bacterium]|jgi:hypothetical protein